MIAVNNLKHHGMRFGMKPIKSCHLITTDDNYDSLHKFAESIGGRRTWFHQDHYNLVGSLREKAIDAGAIDIETDDPDAYKEYLKNRNKGDRG